jgi:regulation of enolase protein 1 (concanavalin A-like superfamily)
LLIALTAMVLLGALWPSAALGQQPAPSTPGGFQTGLPSQPAPSTPGGFQTGLPSQPAPSTPGLSSPGLDPGLPRWRLLNPGVVPDRQFGAIGELGAAFDPVRNRIFTIDWQGFAWVYDFVGAAQAVIRPLNDEHAIRGQSRNCSFAYLPTLDVVVTNLCGSSSNPPDGFAVFHFPDADTVVTTHQCLVDCGGPSVANFLAWNASIGAVVGGGGWSTNRIYSYPLPGGQFPAPETDWVVLPQLGPAPVFPSSCDICKEALRRTVLRNDQYVYIHPLSHDLYTYDFVTSTWAVTTTTKPGPLPVNGVVGYDPVRDILVIWVGSNALYGTGPVTRQTWIYSFDTNQWTLGPSGAAGDTTPGVANAVLNYMVWDSNLNRLILITTDGVASGFTRLWTLDWISPDGLVGLDINTTVAGSTTEVTPDVDYDVVAEGLDIWNTADSFHFSHETVTGDFDQAVQIAAFAGPDIGGKAGLMVRESLNANSRNVLVAATRADGYRFSRRSTIGGTTLNVFKGGAVTYPNVWVRLRRQGNVFTGFTSTDGTNWTQRGQITLSLPATVFFGLASNSRSAGNRAAIRYRSLGPP